MMWFKGGRSLGYQTHYVVDGGKARIIVGALVTPSEVTENRPMLDLLWRAVFRWRIRPHHVTGDGKYGTAENVAVLEKAHIRAYVALHESGSKPGFFAKSEFLYDPQKDAYVCPAGEFLHRVGRSSRGIKYRARASVCEACSLRAQCTTSSQGRSVDRYPGDEYLEKVRLYTQTEPYRKALRKRKVWVEPLFAEAKMWHGMSRFRLRTLRRVNAEALLIAAGQNLKRLLTFGHRLPKQPAQVAALRLPSTANRGLRQLRGHRAESFDTPQRSFCNTLDRFSHVQWGAKEVPRGWPRRAGGGSQTQVDRRRNCTSGEQGVGQLNPRLRPVVFRVKRQTKDSRSHPALWRRPDLDSW